MTSYRVTLLKHAYHVEAVEENGQTRVLRTWRTEEDAIFHLKHLRERADRADNPKGSGNRNWRG